MNILFSMSGSSISVADKDNLIFEINNEFYDRRGKRVSTKEKFLSNTFDFDFDHDEWEAYKMDHEGLDAELLPRSITEEIYEIDDIWGNYGFVNHEDNYIIEPQYAFANVFTCGLAAVNLNRTWYISDTGEKYYENHYGYIDMNGKTVIPFAYDEAEPFNKYGLAVVGDLDRRYIIDTKGNIIPGTEELIPYGKYNYYSRYFKLWNSNEIDTVSYVGIYDTKERKVVMNPTLDSFIEWEEDIIKITEHDSNSKYGRFDFHERFINHKGEPIFKWLMDKGFSIVSVPNDKHVSIVAVSKFTDIEGKGYSGCCEYNGKYYLKEYFYGLYSSNEQFIVPTEYNKIRALTDEIFACYKNGTITVIQLDENDYQ